MRTELNTETKYVILTDHSKLRMKERCGFKKKTQLRMATKAFQIGLPIEESKGLLKKWCQNRSHCETDILKLWGNMLYIFSQEGILITVITVPGKYNTLLQKSLRIN